MKTVYCLVAVLLFLGGVSVRGQTDADPICRPLGDGATGAPDGTGPSREPPNGKGEGGGGQGDSGPSITPVATVTSTLPICPSGTGNPSRGDRKGRSSGSKARLSTPALFTVALTVLRML
ncbi:Hypp4950 [Branchiostoma lanceolatum]|uniref:Hypp4950 protein n=1 Tax=Branchiostoma lanceolatum TaxID=7740 RepID=A0A8K0ABF0_BRALA|nr:Hypp4950 [Branchiostoma lanceolatum]